MIQTGTILQQRYKIDKKIGQGGMGAVYVATDSRFGSTVAIKETLCMDDNFRKAIEREARLLNSLKHSALPSVSDHFEESNGQFLVMEFIPGEDLCCVLGDRGKPFDVQQVLIWADQLLDALDYLHNQEVPVIHRDIKPQNLKLTPRGQIILLDFGLAKGNPTDAGHQTAAKSIFGYSRNYASLEQIQGTGTDPRSDLYSLAATLYHLITNVAPEDALTRAMSILSQKPDPLVPASNINPDVPQGVAGVLQKALDLNASERPTSAAEMRQMLRESEKFEHLVDPDALAHAPTQAQVFSQPTRLMVDATQAGQPTTEDKTEVQAGYSSNPTSARIAETEIVHRRGSGLSVAAGALSVLLVGAAIAAGVYFVKPSVFGIVPTPEPIVTNAANVSAASTAQTENANSGSVNAGLPQVSQANPSVQPSSETPKQGGNAGGSSEMTKSTKTADSEKAMTTVDLGDGTSLQVDDIEDPKNVVIRKTDPDGKVTTMRVTPNMDPELKGMPGANGFDPFPPNFDPRMLTQEQRKKLSNMMKRQQQIIRQRHPVPVTPPTPPK